MPECIFGRLFSSKGLSTIRNRNVLAKSIYFGVSRQDSFTILIFKIEPDLLFLLTLHRHKIAMNQTLLQKREFLLESEKLQTHFKNCF